MILTDEMLALAFKYRAAELWSVLSDSDIFAFRLSDGETGYCCVMGFAGEHAALGFYRGEKGFSSYLKTLQMGSDELSHQELMEAATCLDYTNCDFMQAADMDENVKRRVRLYAKENGLKIPRKNGWPDFVCYRTGKLPHAIEMESDARDIKEALEAALAVAAQLQVCDPIELGFDEKGDYPTWKGGKEVPYLIPDGRGAYEWSRTRLPAIQKDSYLSPLFPSDLTVSALKKLPAGGNLMVRFLFSPMPVKDEADEIPYLPGLLLCVDEATEFVFPVVSPSCFVDHPEPLLLSLADAFTSQGVRPSAIWVADDRTAALLKDFCKRCGIPLQKKSSLPLLDEAYEFLLASMMP